MNRTLILTLNADELDQLVRSKYKDVEGFTLSEFSTSEETDSLIVSYTEQQKGDE